MILSRLHLDPSAGRRVYDVFSNLYRTHQAVWDLFGDHPDRDRDFLYRLDAQRGAPTLMTLSEREPEDERGLWRIESKPFRPRLAEGQTLRFSVRVNPTVKRDGKRHDVVMDAKWAGGYRDLPFDERPPLARLIQEHGVAWLQKRQEHHGFELVDGTVRAEGYAQHRMRKPQGNGKIRLSTLDLEGLLHVRDPERFVAAVGRGFGPAKGFGCGLMLLAPVR